ncbi:MAG: hypothetical protein RLZ81_28 [Pseudomonadota bacterium]|jgi:methionine-rich copper-binding protein CopC
MPTIQSKDEICSESAGFVDFTIFLDAPASSAIKVNYQTGSMSANSSGNGDFPYQKGTVTFLPGITSQKLRIALNDDALAERIENFKLILSDAVNAEIASPQAIATIVDNDAVAATASNPASLSVRDVVVDEKAGTATFFVLLDRPVPNAFSVDYSAANGTAMSGSDFVLPAGSLTFAPNETLKSVTISVVDDNDAEPDELFSLRLGALGGGAANLVQISDGVATALIGRSDGPISAKPGVTVQSVMAGRSDGFVDFVVQLGAPSTSVVYVPYKIGSLTPFAGAEFAPFGMVLGVLVFANGVTTQTVRVNVDSIASQDISFEVGNDENSLAANRGAIATVFYSDAPSVTNVRKANLSVHDVVVDESAGTATFYVVLDRAVASNFSVTYSTQSGTASSGLDFVQATGTLSFGANETVKAVTVNIIDDALAEADELFGLQLGALSANAAGFVQVADALGTAMIGRSDLPASAVTTISAQNMMVGEGDRYLDFVVQLSGPSQNLITAKYAIQGQLTFDDFSFFNSLLNPIAFLPQTTTQTIRVAIPDDVRIEYFESFALTLSDAVNAVIANAVAVATIVDNDITPAATLSKANLSVRDVTVDEKAGTATFYLVLDRSVPNTFTVAYSTSDGTATAGLDFSAALGELTFAAGETLKSVTLNVFDDSEVEVDEQFTLNLGDISGESAALVQLAKGSGIAVIGRSDSAELATPVISARNVTVSETDGYVDFIIQLSAPSANTVTVDRFFRVVSADAVNDFRYPTASTTLTFAPGVTTLVDRVAILQDRVFEATETFNLELKNAKNATVATALVSATILDTPTDTAAPTASFLAPASGATGVDRSSNFVVTFNELIKLGTGDIVLKDALGKVVETMPTATKAGENTTNFQIAGTSLTVNPSAPLAYDTEYRLEFAPGTVKDLAGNNFAGLTTYTFKTLTNLDRTLTGSAGNDLFASGPGNDTINAASGTDTVVYTGQRAEYKIDIISYLSVKDNLGREGTDKLVDVERLKFADIGVAFDLDASQPAGQAQLLLGAVLGKNLLAAKKPLLGNVIDLLDQGYSMQQLAGAAMRLDIWGILANGGSPGATNTQIANYLLTTVNKAVPDAVTLSQAVTALDTEIGADQGNFLWYLSGSSANQSQVGLIGLNSTGLEFGGA